MTTDERMEKMEGQLARVRWFNRCLIACIVLSLGVWFILKTFGPESAWAQSDAKVLRANNFVLEDMNGKPRASLVVGEDGPSLLLIDENGKPRAMLAVLKDGPMLSLLDENGKPRVALAVFKEGPKMVMLDENSKARTIQKVDEAGPDMEVCDESGKPRVALMVVKNDPMLSLLDKNGNHRAMLGAQGLIMFDENGKPIWSAP